MHFYGALEELTYYDYLVSEKARTHDTKNCIRISSSALAVFV
jgi:hypothetical protein